MPTDQEIAAQQRALDWGQLWVANTSITSRDDAAKLGPIMEKEFWAEVAGLDLRLKGEPISNLGILDEAMEAWIALVDWNALAKSCIEMACKREDDRGLHLERAY